MEDKLFDKLDDLNIKDTKLLLEENIDLSIDTAARKRIEKAVMKKTGYYKEQPKNKINNILGGIIMKKKIALALSTVFVLSLAGGTYAYAKTPVAYVSVDINPSVELGVNAFDKVVSVEAYNEDGSNILEGTDLLNVKVDEAVGNVVTNAINDGYIKEDGSSVIEITTSTDKTNVAAELDKTLKDVVDETLNNNSVEAEVETENVALARRDEARKLGITPGKLNLIQKLQVLDPTITVEEYKNRSVKDIQKKTKELRNNDISQTSTQEGTNATATSTDKTNGTSDTSRNSTIDVNTAAETKATEDTVTEKENKKTSNDKANNGNNKKEEVNTNQVEISEPVIEKQNKSENSNLQGLSNSLKQDNGSDNGSSKSENSSKSNSSKSDNGGGSSSNSSNGGNGTSNSQGKGKNK